MLAYSSYKLDCEKGSALLLVIILMFVFSLLSVSMLMLLTTSTQISGNYRRDLETLYIADAGMEHAISILRNDPSAGRDAATWTANDPGEVTFGDGKYKIEDVTLLSPEYPDPSPSIQALYKIVSTGAIGGFKRAVEVYVKFVPISGGTGGCAAVTMSWQTVPPPAS